MTGLFVYIGLAASTLVAACFVGRLIASRRVALRRIPVRVEIMRRPAPRLPRASQ